LQTLSFNTTPRYGPTLHRNTPCSPLPTRVRPRRPSWQSALRPSSPPPRAANPLPLLSRRRPHNPRDNRPTPLHAPSHLPPRLQWRDRGRIPLASRNPNPSFSPSPSPSALSPRRTPRAPSVLAGTGACGCRSAGCARQGPGRCWGRGRLRGRLGFPGGLTVLGARLGRGVGAGDGSRKGVGIGVVENAVAVAVGWGREGVWRGGVAQGGGEGSGAGVRGAVGWRSRFRFRSKSRVSYHASTKPSGKRRGWSRGRGGGRQWGGRGRRAEDNERTVKRVEISKPAVVPVVLDVDLFSPARAHTAPKPYRRRTRPRIGNETIRTPSVFPVTGLSSSRGKEKAGVVTFRTRWARELARQERDDVMMSGAIQGGVLHWRLHGRLHEDNKRLEEVRQLKARIKHLKMAAHRHRRWTKVEMGVVFLFST